MRPDEYDKLANKLLPFILSKVRQASRVTPAPADGDMSATQIMTAVLSLDGPGSLLDADTVDGNHASAFILNSLLTTRGDLIRRGASAPERYGLVVPASPTINYLGVANGETDPTWKSASSNPGAAAALLQSNAAGVLQLQGLIAPYVRPAADSTTALQLQNAAGTAIATIDTTNSRVGISITPEANLHVNTGATAAGLYTGILTSGSNPGNGIRVERHSGGAAAKILNMQLRNTASGITTQMGAVGFFGTADSTPVVDYVWIGTDVNAEYNLASFRVYKEYIQSSSFHGLFFKPISDGITAFRFTSNASETAYLLVGDTTNMRVSINGATPLASLDVRGSASGITSIFKAHATTPSDLTQWRDSTGAILALVSATGGLVVNEPGNTTGDLRAESDTEPNMIFLDASADLLYFGGTAGTKITKGGGHLLPVATKAANYTLTAADNVVVFTATATATLPAATGSGQTYRIICRAGTLTIDASGAETIKGSTTAVLAPGEDLLISDTLAGGWE